MQLSLFTPTSRTNPNSDLEIVGMRALPGAMKFEFKVYGNNEPQQARLYYSTNSEAPRHLATAKPVDTLADGKTVYSVVWDTSLDGLCEGDAINCQIIGSLV